MLAGHSYSSRVRAAACSARLASESPPSAPPPPPLLLAGWPCEFASAVRWSSPLFCRRNCLRRAVHVPSLPKWPRLSELNVAFDIGVKIYILSSPHCCCFCRCCWCAFSLSSVCSARLRRPGTSRCVSPGAQRTERGVTTFSNGDGYFKAVLLVAWLQPGLNRPTAVLFQIGILDRSYI